ncbi:MAG: hypothetical protein QNK23_01075 [Crocinitomicaceae bacterium]|nr:hypothetical protein [Crocinitomicaceae bacterium]
MTLSAIFNALGDLFLWTFQIFEIIGNNINYAFIVLGFVGLFIWLNKQKKFNAAAERNPDKLK